jgi:hypothetical protein
VPYPVRLKQADEFLERARGMPDGQQIGEGSGRGIRLRTSPVIFALPLGALIFGDLFTS